MKKLYMFLIMLFVPFIVNADRIYNVDMYVNIDKEGTAHIEEVWDVKASDGSEWYKSYGNMENIELSNFKVSMDGKLLQEKSNWNVNDTLENKAGYYGVNNKFNGFELCFGKSDFKGHKFTLDYSLSNMVFNTEDSQALYFTFIPKATIDKYNIVVDSYYEFPNTLDVWGYGAKGRAYVKNGQIRMSNIGKVKDNYVTLLVKFPKDTFDTVNHYSKFSTFDQVLNKAKEGTFKYDYNDKKKINFSGILKILLFILMAGVFFGILCLPILIINKIYKNKHEIGFVNNKKINKKNTPLFRDIPCNKDIYYADALIRLDGYCNYSNTNIFGAILLKWIKEDKISLVSKNKKFSKSTVKIDMTKKFVPDKNSHPSEEELYQMMYDSSKDGFLEPKEFEEWALKHSNKFFKVFHSFADNEIDKLKEQGHIYKRTSKSECSKVNVMDDKLYKDSQELYGLKLFLKEFTEIDKKEAIEVKLWDEYLMFAYLFGIAKKVLKQFKNLYPEIVRDMEAVDFDYDAAVFIDNFSNDVVVSATDGMDYSSGGGGFSSGGGGGDSFGSDGSMGGR